MYKETERERERGKVPKNALSLTDVNQKKNYGKNIHREKTKRHQSINQSKSSIDP